MPPGTKCCASDCSLWDRRSADNPIRSQSPAENGRNSRPAKLTFHPATHSAKYFAARCFASVGLCFGQSCGLLLAARIADVHLLAQVVHHREVVSLTDPRVFKLTCTRPRQDHAFDLGIVIVHSGRRGRADQSQSGCGHRKFRCAVAPQVARKIGRRPANVRLLPGHIDDLRGE